MTHLIRSLYVLLRLSFALCAVIVGVCGCASSKIYVDTDEVPGLGAVVEFPTGKIIPIRVKRIISGNIIELSNKEQVVYIGLYIPQLYNIFEEARELNEKLVTDNEIRLEFDKRQRDSKGRLLAYVYTTGGIFINAEIIRQGLAKALVSPPNLKHKDLLTEAEDSARRDKRGIWSEDFKR